jgi:hypothetical protein
MYLYSVSNVIGRNKSNEMDRTCNTREEAGVGGRIQFCRKVTGCVGINWIQLAKVNLQWLFI